jgi:diguanylate cyclase (GGDEF)-like protein
VLFVDLDNFKAVNDTLGHDAGDRLLAQVAERLLNATRGCDTVARLGGDEFAVLLERLGSPAEAETVAQRIVVAMRPSFTIEGRAMHVGASVGIACAADDSVDELLRNADLAMYRAKSCGKGRHAVFVPEMHAALLRRVELEEELRDAVERGDLALVYQPIVELADQQVVGFEALVRWTHPRLGPVPPSVFIPVAEEAGTIPALGRWVLATACREAASWPEGEGGVRAPGLSVNVSGHQLEEAGFVDVVRAVLAETGLAAARLTLEITESVLMRDSEAMLERLHELKALGVRLAIDDFGTGYSSLSYLHRFPGRRAQDRQDVRRRGGGGSGRPGAGARDHRARRHAAPVDGGRGDRAPRAAARGGADGVHVRPGLLLLASHRPVGRARPAGRRGGGPHRVRVAHGRRLTGRDR